MIEGGLSARFAVNQETPLAAHPADVRKAQEVEGLGLAEAPLPVLLMGEPAKADQPGLVGVECETERLRAFGDLAPEARGIVRVLEPHDDVIGVPYHHDGSPGLALAPSLYPEVEGMVQEDVGEEWRDDRPLRGADRPVGPASLGHLARRSSATGVSGGAGADPGYGD